MSNHLKLTNHRSKPVVCGLKSSPKLMWADYNHCLTNVACSVLAHFGLPHRHATLPLLDSFLQKKDYKNIVIMLYDGLGTAIMKKNLPEDSFLRRHFKGEISSVFPATTAAATTSILSGLNPCEHGRVGYNVYIKALDEVVTIFENVIKDTERAAADYEVMTKMLPYDGVANQINRLPGCAAHVLFPFGEDAYRDWEDMRQKITKLCASEGKKYIYAYTSEPDHAMHHYGTTGPNVTPLIQQLDNLTERLADELEDTLLVVLADHGHYETQVIAMETECPQLCRLLTRNTAIEGRACAFWVAEENQAEFKAEFERLYGKEFLLFTKEEVLKRQLFGDGEPCDNFTDSIGDFLAVAVGNRYLERYAYPDSMRSYHAGLIEDEMMVPLVVVEK